jgi:hypothetical protein
MAPPNQPAPPAQSPQASKNFITRLWDRLANENELPIIPTDVSSILDKISFKASTTPSDKAYELQQSALYTLRELVKEGYRQRRHKRMSRTLLIIAIVFFLLLGFLSWRGTFQTCCKVAPINTGTAQQPNTGTPAPKPETNTMENK